MTWNGLCHKWPGTGLPDWEKQVAVWPCESATATVNGADERASQEARGVDLALQAHPLAAAVDQHAGSLGDAGGGGGLDRLEGSAADAAGRDHPGSFQAMQVAGGAAPLDRRLGGHRGISAAAPFLLH